MSTACSCYQGSLLHLSLLEAPLQLHEAPRSPNSSTHQTGSLSWWHQLILQCCKVPHLRVVPRRQDVFHLSMVGYIMFSLPTMLPNSSNYLLFENSAQMILSLLISESNLLWISCTFNAHKLLNKSGTAVVRLSDLFCRLVFLRARHVPVRHLACCVNVD